VKVTSLRSFVVSSYFYGMTALALLGLLTPAQSRATEMASATLSETPVSPGVNQYSLTLNDTGTTTAGTFWFAWVSGDNFMPVSPTNITTPSGWVETVTTGGASGGFAIQWKAASAANDLAAGSSLSGFSFDSTLSLAQLEAPSVGHPTDPVDTAFIYSGAPFSDAGFQLTASTAAPEPAATGLATLGLAAVGLGLARRSLRRNH